MKSPLPHEMAGAPSLDSLSPATTATSVQQDVARLEDRARRAVLNFSTVNFTLLFAVWLMFGVLSVPIQKEMGLSDVQLGWLTAIPILNGAIWRLGFGILTDRLGGRLVMTALMLFTAIPVFLVAFAQSFEHLLVAAFFIGLAGNSFNVGISWNSAWFPKERQGFALGMFGAGNVGASITKLGAPAVLLALPAAGLFGFIGWRVIPPIYALILVVMALWMWFSVPAQDRKPAAGRPLRELLQPLKKVQVWRFSLYYVVVFGAYVALSSWLPKYFVKTYGVDLKTAGFITALFIIPASLLRPVGGYLSDKMGARGLMYATFAVMLGALVPLTLFVPNIYLFTALLFAVGVAMGIGKSAVFRFIPTYYPNEVGAVGGLVGTLGALGGFFLTPLFAYVAQSTHIQQSAFGLVALVTFISLVWFHFSVQSLQRRSLETLSAT